MNRVPRSSAEILDLSLNLETGELSVANVVVKPSGSGTDYPDVVMDDAKALFNELQKLRDECFQWRLYAARQNEWRAMEPCVPHSGKTR